MMATRKESIVKEEETSSFCIYCGELAELMCGKCELIFYCKQEHQKLDWANHSKICKSRLQKRRQHFESQRLKKGQLFELISRLDIDISRAVFLVDRIEANCKSFLAIPQNVGDFQCQLELGALICTHVRLVYAAKQFNTAQNLLSDYFREKIYFLSDIDNISSFADIQNLEPKEKQEKGYLTSGKLKLISTLANLAHDIYRNSIDMFEILVTNTEKAYGQDSLQVSNIYFYAANYLNSIKLPTKALACFLKCGKMRKQKGGTSYYNVALLLLQAKRKKKALQYFQKALELLQKQVQNQQSYVIIPAIFENIALIYMSMGMARTMMQYFQKAYYFYKRMNNKPKAQILIRLFMLIRNQSKQQRSQDMKMIEFHKQKKDKKSYINLSSKNNQKYKNADKITEQDESKLKQWLQSFREIKFKNNEPDLIKYPAKELQYLFGNDTNKNNQEEDPSYLINKINNAGTSEGINMDVKYMRSLNSIEVGYLTELNRLLMECRERAAVFDILENSNFYQIIDREKLNKFYKLNPSLVRPSDLNNRMLFLGKVQEEEQDFEYSANEPKKIVTPKLDLSKLKQMRFQ